MKILLLGKNGQVGWELQRSLAPLGQVLALDRHSTVACGDLNRPDELAQTVRNHRPHVIVNAAAHTAVDRAETEHELATVLNSTAPEALAQAAREVGAWLVHYSTDYVFNGEGSTPWRESDITSPLNVYGRTKQDGEIAIAHSGCQHLIFRTSWVYAARGGNFARTMLRLAQERERLTVIAAIAIEDIERADRLQLVLFQPHGEYTCHARIEARAKQRQQPRLFEAVLIGPLPVVFELGDVLGQETNVEVLQNAAKAGRLGQAYIFYGARGTGKTTTARLLAKLLNCEKRRDDPASRQTSGADLRRAKFSRPSCGCPARRCG